MIYISGLRIKTKCVTINSHHRALIRHTWACLPSVKLPQTPSALSFFLCFLQKQYRDIYDMLYMEVAGGPAISWLLEVVSFLSELQFSLLWSQKNHSLFKIILKIHLACFKYSTVGGHCYYYFDCYDYFYYCHNHVWKINERNLELIWDCSIFCIF